MDENIFVVGANAEITAAFNQTVEMQENAKKFFFVNESSNNDISWNRASPVSARTILLQAKNLYSEFNTGIVIFNSVEFAKFFKFNVETITKAVDSMILGNSYICSELINHINETGNGNLVFVLLNNIAEKNTVEKSILQEVGEASFIALAEGIAQKYASKNLGITLVNSDEETFTLNIGWLFNYLENPASKKHASLGQKACKWIKPGAKPPVLLPFLKG